MNACFRILTFKNKYSSCKAILIKFIKLKPSRHHRHQSNRHCFAVSVILCYGHIISLIIQNFLFAHDIKDIAIYPEKVDILLTGNNSGSIMGAIAVDREIGIFNLPRCEIIS